MYINSSRESEDGIGGARHGKEEERRIHPTDGRFSTSRGRATSVSVAKVSAWHKCLLFNRFDSSSVGAMPDWRIHRHKQKKLGNHDARLPS
ncbi:MAG: hypothetical protein KDA85_03245 [Planctomycetaceae bacterium]|nr:hypothetical protein [Planctomycetaceae bacterium]